MLLHVHVPVYMYLYIQRVMYIHTYTCMHFLYVCMYVRMSCCQMHTFNIYIYIYNMYICICICVWGTHARLLNSGGVAEVSCQTISAKHFPPLFCSIFPPLFVLFLFYHRHWKQTFRDIYIYTCEYADMHACVFYLII